VFSEIGIGTIFKISLNLGLDPDNENSKNYGSFLKSLNVRKHKRSIEN
jgi:hypothetical protein